MKEAKNKRSIAIDRLKKHHLDGYGCKKSSLSSSNVDFTNTLHLLNYNKYLLAFVVR